MTILPCQKRDYITINGHGYIVVWTMYEWGNNMPDEENPFLVTPKKTLIQEKKENFGSDEMVSFMVSPEETKNNETRKIESTTATPHWESSGTPIWDRKVKNVDDEDYEVVEHK